MISHKYRFMCPRIGKNASSTLVEYFKQFDKNLIDEGHDSVLGRGFQAFLESRYMMGRDHKKYYKFAFARNPFDRLVSAYYEFIKPEQFYDIKILIERDNNFSLTDVLNNFSSFVKMTQKYPHIHWNPQLRMMQDVEGKMLVHYIGKVENIKLDLFNICNVVGIKENNVNIPTERASKNRTHYSEYYDDKLKSIVGQIYTKDLDYFEYDFASLGEIK